MNRRSFLALVMAAPVAAVAVLQAKPSGVQPIYHCPCCGDPLGPWHPTLRILLPDGETEFYCLAPYVRNAGGWMDRDERAKVFQALQEAADRIERAQWDDLRRRAEEMKQSGVIRIRRPTQYIVKTKR